MESSNSHPEGMQVGSFKAQVLTWIFSASKRPLIIAFSKTHALSQLPYPSSCSGMVVLFMAYKILDPASSSLALARHPCPQWPVSLTFPVQMIFSQNDSLLPWRLRPHIPPKCRYPPTIPDDVITQKTRPILVHYIIQYHHRLQIQAINI